MKISEMIYIFLDESDKIIILYVILYTLNNSIIFSSLSLFLHVLYNASLWESEASSVHFYYLL